MEQEIASGPILTLIVPLAEHPASFLARATSVGAVEEWDRARVRVSFRVEAPPGGRWFVVFSGPPGGIAEVATDLAESVSSCTCSDCCSREQETEEEARAHAEVEQVEEGLRRSGIVVVRPGTGGFEA